MPSQDTRNSSYVRAQIDQLIQDLCAFTGKTWDEERFREVMKISQRNSSG